ncbi:MAG: iron-containing redox enzyme family protein [Okeania sp. SIO3B5]|uniref:iron-containing redox enzyme family protein n=1 Tax=Okeania sp. SIO3B5 TaxID=2607811 RepID=UPI00140045E3|nr:iron-containing redox enzyme family protein [Okeania sp. SIO3B5]NEO53669.1 iron-containing redox enzyme family protein [Okeania sp. SIO3B5]
MVLMTFPSIKQSFWQALESNKFSGNPAFDPRLQSLRNISLPELIKVLEQYSYVTKIHAQSLNYVCNVIKPGKLKFLLDEIYFEETGDGNPNNSHYNLLKKFLFGLNEAFGGTMLTNTINPQVDALIENYENDLKTHPAYVAIGMAGMGTECICGPILEEIWAQIQGRKDLEDVLPKLNLEFWGIHTGEIDHSHAVRMRNAIDGEVGDSEEFANQILQGYQLSVKFWDDLLNIFVTISA